VPYYDKVEQLIGVAGGSEDVHNTPAGKHLLPPFNPRCGELLIKKGAAKLGIKVLSKPLAVLSQPYDGRPPCHYCGACNWGCDVGARYSSLDVLIPKLQKLGNFELRTNAPVHTILRDRSTGKARGVTYIDANNRQEYEAYGKAVVLAASMIESIRLSRDKYQGPFHEIPAADQETLLMAMSLPEREPGATHAGFGFYALVKDMTVEGFYTSRVGLIDVLGYKGLAILSEFPGCTHPEHQM
jgi:choline dehydrogenase-like flavoprotein